jgi:hypothetical protein
MMSEHCSHRVYNIISEANLTLPAITQGSFHAYRLFEVAEEINLSRLDQIHLPASVTLRPGRLSFFGRLRTLLSVIALGTREVEFETGMWVQVDCTVLVFSFGVMAPCFLIPIGESQSTQPIAAAMTAAEAATFISRLNDSQALTDLGRQLTETVSGLIASAITRPIVYEEYESYTLLTIQQFATPIAIDEVLKSADLGRLLLGETPDWEPAPSFLAQLLKDHYRYAVDDLCVIDWNAAVTIEPTPTEDVPDLIALALTQLLEYQRYDAILEQELDVLYEWAFQKQASSRWWRPGMAQRGVDRVNRVLLDIGDFIDRSQNVFKITEDAHYARIYRGAIERFQVPAWRSAVVARQQAVAEVARTMFDRAHLSIAHFLETVIILLIAFDIVWAFFK